MDSYYHVGEGGGYNIMEREHMFEKPLTPSDVGKLNRLVIPKQHAERYFPLAADSGEKGLLLSFEDEAGKAWQFRYSYWTSSQSYVLTKGWSRFVKEKRLDAGDFVLFERTPGGGRLYIGCRRRSGSIDSAPAHGTAAAAAVLQWSPVFYAASNSHPSDPSAACLYYNPMQQDCHHLHSEGQSGGGVAGSTVAPANSRRLRLFGVNLDCGPDHF